MQQVKIFKGIETEVSSLEQDVNAWIRETGAKVISITGNIAPQSAGTGATTAGLGAGPYAPSDIVLVVLYEAPHA